MSDTISGDVIILLITYLEELRKLPDSIVDNAEGLNEVIFRASDASLYITYDHILTAALACTVEASRAELYRPSHGPHHPTRSHSQPPEHRY